MGNKYCRRCQQNKSVADFYRNKDRVDGLQDWCKLCSSTLRLSAPGRYSQLIKRGERRGVKFNIPKEEFILWFNGQEHYCHYCGWQLKEYRNGNMQGLTIDRQNNDKPYVIGNIVLACRRCNTMKGSWLTEEQMLDAANRYFK
ncbi:hypothetical protein LCGC14_1226480 [marine sediment metagenome]|uniref:HNH domain-containing protein n=1 Tax=marine sediment metagenome TaxID=412755 RepID=A0A0F9L9R3_9ZZZZ